MKRGFLFGSVPAPKVGRNVFDLSHEFKFSCAMGRLIPLFIQEQLPGDYHRFRPSALVRTQALISPLMHRIDVGTNYFQVPLRILWDGFEDFITGGEDGLQAPQKPFFTLYSLAAAFGEGDPDMTEEQAVMYFGPSSLLAYMGVPPKLVFNSANIPIFNAQEYVGWSTDDHPAWADEPIDGLPFRAYYKICYDYFRDQNLDDMPAPVTTSGPMSIDELQSIFEDGFREEGANGAPYQRAWKKDYFTSALPDSQRGPEASIPLGNSMAPVYGTGVKGDALRASSSLEGSLHTLGGAFDPNDNALQIQGKTQSASFTFAADSQIGQADLSQVSPIGIIALRNAFKLQQFLERNNIGGGRYIESILAHFGVKSPDRRLQRPAYLGGSSTPIVISEIETNANGSGVNDNVVGDLAGKGKMFGNLGTASCFATEHCLVFGLMSIMPTAAYCQGLPRMFSRFDKFDYAWPEFQNIGEQSIKLKELYFHQPTSAAMNSDFGYTPRYAEYKYNSDRFAGDMLTSLSYWHMGRIFKSSPNLNSQFVHADPTDRIFAVLDETSDQHIIVDAWIEEKSARPFQKYGIPSIN